MARRDTGQYHSRPVRHQGSERTVSGYGLRNQVSEGSRSARLLGCYEASLVPVIEEIIARAYPLVIDIGSAEGYYAVGLARRMSESRILARDQSQKAQTMCGQLAALNGVADRVEVGGLFTHADFALALAQPTLILCDIEGAEIDLLDLARAPGLSAADILVECHDCLQPGITDALTNRFTATHTVLRIDRSLNAAPLPPWMEELSDIDRLLALWEWRMGPTPWLWMRHKSTVAEPAQSPITEAARGPITGQTGTPVTGQTEVPVTNSTGGQVTQPTGSPAARQTEVPVANQPGGALSGSTKGPNP